MARLAPSLMYYVTDKDRSSSDEQSQGTECSQLGDFCESIES